jgi:O-antigen/teichoic acid export membrane protein
VLRKGLLAIVDQGLVAGTSFLTSVIIARLGSPEDLGVYALALTLATILRGVQGELVCSPYTVYCNRCEGTVLPAYTGSTLLHYLALTVLSVLGLLGVAGVLSLGIGPAGTAGAVWILAGAVPFLLLREYIRQVSLAHLRLTTVLAIDGCVCALQIGGLVLLGFCGWMTVGTAYAVMGVACAAACVGWFLARQQPLEFVRARIVADWRHNWTFARWSLASFLIGSATPALVPWLVALTHGEAATGVLAACVTLINCAGTYVTGVSNLLTPRAARAFASGGLPELKRVLGQTAVLFLVTLGAFFLAILATGDLAARLVYGGRFAETGTVLALLALNMLINSLGITAGNGLWAMDRPRANFLADVCSFVVAFSFLLCLVGPFGVPGAALATLAGTTVGVAVRWWTLATLMRQGSKPAA